MIQMENLITTLLTAGWTKQQIEKIFSDALTSAVAHHNWRNRGD